MASFSRYRHESQSTPLHYAAKCGHLEVVRLLIKKGAAPDEADVDGRRPLHYAALDGHKEVCQLLMAQGDVDVHAPDRIGRKPHDLIMENGHLDVVQLLTNPDTDTSGMNLDST